jgi:hypothetical protein
MNCNWPWDQEKDGFPVEFRGKCIHCRRNVFSTQGDIRKKNKYFILDYRTVPSLEMDHVTCVFCFEKVTSILISKALKLERRMEIPKIFHFGDPDNGRTYYKLSYERTKKKKEEMRQRGKKWLKYPERTKQAKYKRQLEKEKKDGSE